MMAFRHEKLEVWKLATDLVDEIYKVTKNFPPIEQFGLTNQIRRAAVSVSLNITEGANRQSKKEFAQFTRTAIGSLMELDTGLVIGLRQGYLSDDIYQKLRSKIQELYFKLIALHKSLRQ